ncbi:short-chain fatty acyl-CoA regulator family protein [Spongiibacter taiwanensis]|uniref:short-chain fatty acyl-CoA regulator family protein n=1 Tax=Spongiibacter taiwanensis TaxID=1748242 RepID=UPI0020352FE9|nr:short-chain fatty acyl-CoA regulator family protein [Spongiibacter taiwanensis]USA43736.1 short-chain fatty acyl-CoA regulator family protein [Spongiibacter taiwanensis]
MRKIYMGVRLRALREERQWTQTLMAQQLDISPSYLNQIENNDRPLTVQVLLKLQSRLGVDPQFFSEDEEARLLAQLRDAVADMAADVPNAELQGFVQQMPALAELVTRLHKRCSSAEERNIGLTNSSDDRNKGGASGLAQPHEEVRDFFYARHNYIDALDTYAETLYETLTLSGGAIPGGAIPSGGRSGAGKKQDTLSCVELIPLLREYLFEAHGVRVLRRSTKQGEALRHYDPEAKILQIDTTIEPGRQAFQLANQLAHLEVGALIESITEDAEFSGDSARELTGIGLASYFAGALILPYRRFLQAAEQRQYDIELLSEQFGVSFETICHRLSTLQRPDARGVPFFFVRVDRAGNISKRQSATDFHFSRTGGTCPLWAVYEAFSQPERILTQLATMPDGRSYLWLARCVTHRRGGFGKPARTFAIGLGCDLRHAERLVYAKGLNLNDPSAATPIGAGCKVCHRNDCGQRAFPALDRPLYIDPHSREWQPYPIDVRD